MHIIQPTNIQLCEQSANGFRFCGAQGEKFQVSVLDDDLIRVTHRPDGQSRLARTWAIVGENGDVPIEGRPRDDYSPFPLPPFKHEVTAGTVKLHTTKLQLSIQLGDFGIRWADEHGREFAADLSGRAYPYDTVNGSVYHYLERRPTELYYGFGERSGELNKKGRRFRFFNIDAMGYSAKSGDPLYKHIPFYITFEPELNIAYGLFYDNLATTTFDMGQEIDNYYPAYRSYCAEGGDVDYYLIYGHTIAEVVQKFTKLTGRMTLPPRWSLGYLGSTMSYTDAPDAQEQLKKFVDLCEQHDIPCDLFHLSSGYSSGEDGKRYVFQWNERKIPQPKQMVDHFHQAGIRLTANIKPCLLTTHPRFEEVEQFDGFINTADNSTPELAMFWGGKGAHLDFTNPATYAWWKAQVREHVLELNIDSTWNDNNEYSIENDSAVCDGFGELIPLGLIRPLHSLLMTRASYEAQREYRPTERPYLIIRSGCVGLQRYAQTWSGDNRTSWETLRYNIPMGLGMGLSGVANIGHDVGGFAGSKPSPELFVRWVQNGIFHPRFTIHSWNDDGSVNEPWMYPEILPIVRDMMRFRYRMIPYLYSLFWESAETGNPIVRPMVYHFSHDPNCHTESFDFMLGSHLLVASVLDEGARTRSVYLPTGTSWFDFYSGERFDGGQTITLPAPLDHAPLLVRAGGILPFGKPMRFVGSEADDVRKIYLFPALFPALFPDGESGRSHFTLVEDDGHSTAYQQGEQCKLQFEMVANKETIELHISQEGAYKLPYSNVEFVLREGEKRPLNVSTHTGVETQNLTSLQPNK